MEVFISFSTVEAMCCRRQRLRLSSPESYSWIDGKIKERTSVQEGNPASYFFYNSQVPAAGVLLEFFRSGFGFGQQPAEGHGLGLIDARGFELI